MSPEVARLQQDLQILVYTTKNIFFDCVKIVQKAHTNIKTQANDREPITFWSLTQQWRQSLDQKLAEFQGHVWPDFYQNVTHQYHRILEQVEQLDGLKKIDFNTMKQSLGQVIHDGFSQLQGLPEMAKNLLQNLF